MAKTAGEKLLSEVVQERRATNNFEEVPIHAADLEKIVRAGLETPSGYNLQPWRFIVVRDREQKKKLRGCRLWPAQGRGSQRSDCGLRKSQGMERQRPRRDAAHG